MRHIHFKSLLETWLFASYYDPAWSHVLGHKNCIQKLRLQILPWRHNERDRVSNHRRLDCLLKLLLRRRSKETSNLRKCFVKLSVTWPLHKMAMIFNILRPREKCSDIVDDLQMNFFNENVCILVGIYSMAFSIIPFVILLYRRICIWHWLSSVCVWHLGKKLQWNLQRTSCASVLVGFVVFLNDQWNHRIFLFCHRNA